MTSLSGSSRLWFPQSLCAVTEQIDVESAGLIRNTRFLSDSTRLKILGALRGLGCALGGSGARVRTGFGPRRKWGKGAASWWGGGRSAFGPRRKWGKDSFLGLCALPWVASRGNVEEWGKSSFRDIFPCVLGAVRGRAREPASGTRGRAARWASGSRGRACGGVGNSGKDGVVGAGVVGRPPAGWTAR